MVKVDGVDEVYGLAHSITDWCKMNAK